MKKRLRDLLEHGDFEAIAAWAERKKRVLGVLVSLTYDSEPLIGWRAVEAMGLAASRVVKADRQFVREHLRRLYWLLSEESGGLCWRAPEAIAEIVRHEPEMFADYIPIVVSLLKEMTEEDLAHFRAGILWAIGRLGPVADDHISTVLPAIALALNNGDPQVRGMAVWCLGQVGQHSVLADRSDLLADEGMVEFYKDGVLERTPVRRLVRHIHGE